LTWSNIPHAKKLAIGLLETQNIDIDRLNTFIQVQM